MLAAFGVVRAETRGRAIGIARSTCDSCILAVVIQSNH